MHQVLPYQKLPPSLDQHLLTHGANRSTEDAINILQSHLDHLGTSVRLLFFDCGSVFRTIITSRLETSLLGLAVNQHTCQWIKDFISNQSQSGWRLTVSTGAPQGCVLSLLLFVRHTRDCTSICSTITTNSCFILSSSLPPNLDEVGGAKMQGSDSRIQTAIGEVCKPLVTTVYRNIVC